MNGKNIANYTAEEFEKEVKPTLDKYGVKFSSIGSPIGKIRWDDDDAYEGQLKKLEELVKICKIMDCKYIRMFSFRVKKDEYEKAYPTVVEKIKGFLEKCRDTDIVLLHENEKRIYGDERNRCVKLYKEISERPCKLYYDATK